MDLAGCQPHPAQAVVGDARAPATSPSTTRMPRASSCSRSSSVGAGPVWTKSVTSALHWRHSSDWCTDSGPVAEHADRAVADLPAVAVRAVQHVAAPPLGDARHVGQLVDETGREHQAARLHRAAVGQLDAEARAVLAALGRHRADASLGQLPAVRRDLRAAGGEQLGRRRALAGQVVVHVPGGRVARARRRRRPAPSAAPAPGSAPRSARPLRRRPPPRRTSRPSCAPVASAGARAGRRAASGVRRRLDKRRCRSGKLCRMTDRRAARSTTPPSRASCRRSGRGCGRCAGARRHPRPAVRGDGHLGQHAVAARVRRRRPTLELLLPLARAHQVPLDQLVDAPATGDPRVRARARSSATAVTVPARSPAGPAACRRTS